jgi:hypothetical protein
MSKSTFPSIPRTPSQPSGIGDDPGHQLAAARAPRVSEVPQVVAHQVRGVPQMFLKARGTAPGPHRQPAARLIRRPRLVPLLGRRHSRGVSAS